MKQHPPPGWQRQIRTGDSLHTVVVEGTTGNLVQVRVDDRQRVLNALPAHLLDGSRSHAIDVEVDEQGNLAAVFVDGLRVEVELLRGPSRQGSGRLAAEGGVVRSPMNGQVVKVLAAVGQVLAAGDCVVMLEAMKMENEVRSAVPGQLLRLEVRVGQTVARGDVLFEVTPPLEKEVNHGSRSD